MLLRLLGAAVLSCLFVTAGVVAQEAPVSGTALVTRVFKVPLEIFTQPGSGTVGGERKTGQGVRLLPALSGELPGQRRFDVRDFLKLQGVEVSAEGEATFFEEASALVIRASEEQIQLVEALFVSPCDGPIPFVQVTFSLVRFTLKEPLKDSVGLSYATLRREAGDSWHVIDQQLLTTRSGTAARYATGNGSGRAAFVGVSVDGKADRLAGQFQLRDFAENEAGTRLEVEPVIGPDALTVDVNLTYRHRSKANGREAAYEHELTTSVPVWSGYPEVLQLVTVEQAEPFGEPQKYRALILKTQIVYPSRWRQGHPMAQPSDLQPR